MSATRISSTIAPSDVVVNNLISSNIPQGETVTVAMGANILATVTGTFRIYSFDATPPSDIRQLWVDPNVSTGGLKYFNGSAWVHLPVAYT